MSKAFSAVFQRMVQRAWPLPVGPSDHDGHVDALQGGLLVREVAASLWSPWALNRVRSILALLRETIGRGRRVTVFIRDDRDRLQARPDAQNLIADLRAVVHTVIPVNVMH